MMLAVPELTELPRLMPNTMKNPVLVALTFIGIALLWATLLAWWYW
jgi:hypothetical protein